MPGVPTGVSGSAATRTQSRRASISGPASPTYRGRSFLAAAAVAAVVAAAVAVAAAAAPAAADDVGSEVTAAADAVYRKKNARAVAVSRY